MSYSGEAIKVMSSEGFLVRGSFFFVLCHFNNVLCMAVLGELRASVCYGVMLGG